MAYIRIEVPDGPFCWRSDMINTICYYFDNPAGLPECKLGFDNSKEIPEGTLRPLECKDKEIK